MDAPLDENPEQKFTSLPGAARRLGVSTDTIRRRVAEGKLVPCQLCGEGPLRFRIADLDAAMVPVVS